MGKTISKKTIQAVLASMISLSNCWGMEVPVRTDYSNPFITYRSPDCFRLIIETMVDEPEITIQDFVSFSSTCMAIYSNYAVHNTLYLFWESMDNRKKMEQDYKKYKITSPYFFSLDFSGMNLVKQDLRSFFTGENKRSLCSSINFSKSNLTCATFQGSGLMGGNFEGSVLKNTNLRNTNLLDFYFVDGGWWHREKAVSYTTFKNANVQGILLKGAKIQQKSLEGAIFSKESLAEINLVPEDYKHPINTDQSATDE